MSLQQYAIATCNFWHFAMFDPSLGTLEGSCAENDYFSRNVDVKGFPMTYYTLRPAMSPYSRTVPDSLALEIQKATVIRKSKTFCFKPYDSFGFECLRTYLLCNIFMSRM